MLFRKNSYNVRTLLVNFYAMIDTILNAIKGLFGGSSDGSSSSSGGYSDDPFDASARFGYVSDISQVVNDVSSEMESFSDYYKKGEYYDALGELENDLSEWVTEMIADLEDSEPHEDVNNDLTLRDAALNYLKKFQAEIPNLVAATKAAEAGNKDQADKMLDEFNAKEVAWTNEWNDILVAFCEKHHVPEQDPFMAG